MRVGASRGLAREALGLWILSYICYEVLQAVCHSPFPEVSAVFCFFDVFRGLSSGGRFLVWGAPLSAGGLREAYGCGVWSGGWGASVLPFFGERGPAGFEYGVGPVGSGMGRLGAVQLGAWRSVRAELGRL